MTTFERLHPKFSTSKRGSPLIFIDTYMWVKLLKDDTLKSLLHDVCAKNQIRIVITSAIEGELTGRKKIDAVRQVCGNSLVIIPVERIILNQVVYALFRYAFNQKEICYEWDNVIADLSPIRSIKNGLHQMFENIAEEMRKLKEENSFKTEKYVGIFVDIERKFYKELLKIYGKMLEFMIPTSDDIDTKERKIYESFFYTDYFTDIPAILYRCYFFAYALEKKDFKVNDVVDIYTISELLPFVDLFLMDKDQHNRFRMDLQRRYSEYFGEQVFFNENRVYSNWKNECSKTRCCTQKFFRSS